MAAILAYVHGLYTCASLSYRSPSLCLCLPRIYNGSLFHHLPTTTKRPAATRQQHRRNIIYTDTYTLCITEKRPSTVICALPSMEHAHTPQTCTAVTRGGD
ncbi:40S ribosomal protein S4, putative [Leishmania donovani]|uniref:40S ribosomal protein S4, putative n=1 Tax=Leishmania donovani TaxID=5661 RepID=E9BBI7_LEIDO|nr:40S ribosomal protein S4, putative [Leishmania donovani]CBZ32612.1 40S ribosomal protein S4, putative [Leishmania donovani]